MNQSRQSQVSLSDKVADIHQDKVAERQSSGHP